MKSSIKYQGKGTVKLKQQKSVSASTTPTPGMGKGTVKGSGIAETGTKFNGVY